MIRNTRQWVPDCLRQCCEKGTAAPFAPLSRSGRGQPFSGSVFALAAVVESKFQPRAVNRELATWNWPHEKVHE